MGANKLTEPYWLAWLKWHLYRRRKGARHAAIWQARRFIRGLPDGGLMVDCGANVGDVSRLFLDKGYTVHAFEPDPDARAALERRLGDRPGLTIHAAAVSDTAGEMVLHRMSGGLDGTISSSLYRRDVHAGGDTATVPVVDLFAFIASLGRPVDVLKLDIEGAEVPVLEAMLAARHDRRIGHVLVETHEKFSPDFAARIEAIRRRLDALGVANVNLDWQ